MYPGKRSVCFKEVRMCVAETVRALIETWQPGIIDTGGGGGVWGVWKDLGCDATNSIGPHIGLCIVFMILPKWQLRHSL